MAPRYPRQRLRSVSIETYFPGSFAFSACFPDVQSATAEEFPNLYVPHAADGQPLALTPYHLKNADFSRSILLAINQCSFVADGDQYPGYDAFRSETEKVFEIAFSRCAIERFSRVQYRYRNRLLVPPGSPENSLPLAEILTFAGPEWFDESGLLTLDLNWSQAWDQGILGFEIAQRDDEFTFEIVAAVNNVLKDGLWDAVADAHDKAVDTFEAMITDEYRTAIAGAEEA